jgi:hypothetical protein
MKIMINFFIGLLFVLLTSNMAVARNLDDKLRVYYFMFNADTYLPIKFKDIENDPGNFLMNQNDFEQLLFLLQPTQENKFFENIRMRVKTKKGMYYINKDGFIYFNKKILGKLNRKILNSIDLGYGLYELKTGVPLSSRMIAVVNQGGNIKLKLYLQNVGDLADWRNQGFIGYEASLQ